MSPIAHPGYRSRNTEPRIELRTPANRHAVAALENGVERRAAVLDSPKGPRLVIIESDRIIRWETFRLTRELRGRAVQIRRELRKAGWINQKKDS